MDEMAARVEALRDLVKTQCADGNWDYDPYMHGMANGMILSLAVMEGKKPEYLDAPGMWRRDVQEDCVINSTEGGMICLKK